MSDSQRDYDPIGVVVDWLDACRAADLDTLLALYEIDASLECKCEGRTYQGTSEIKRYWEPKLSTQVRDGFVLDDIHPENSGVGMRYFGFEGKPLQIIFQFSESGKIKRTACRPLPISPAKP